MHHTTRLSYLMQLSWEIQKKKHHSRSKALQAPWAITQNEDITIYYLVKRHSHQRYPNKVEAQHLSLFNSH
jgi:hypothetical protein